MAILIKLLSQEYQDSQCQTSLFSLTRLATDTNQRVKHIIRAVSLVQLCCNIT